MNKNTIYNQTKIQDKEKTKQIQHIFSFVLYCDLLYPAFCSGDF